MHTHEPAPPGLLGSESGATACDDGWPTTLRYIRRLGEALRGAAYAGAVERPREHPERTAAIVFVAAVVSMAVTFALQVV